MKAAVIYDSSWGNTEKIAKAIASGLGSGTQAHRVGAGDTQDLDQIDLLVVGSPVLGGQPSKAMQRFVNSITPATARKLKVAALDTRVAAKFVKIFGYAATRMADQLKKKGSTLKANPEGFVVKGRTGPLAEGELERAARWGRYLANL